MIKQLHEILQFSRLTEIVDIGAYPFNDAPPYKALIKSGLCKLTGFEPQKEGLDRLNQEKGANESYLPYAVGNGMRQTLNICAFPGCSSMLKPSLLALHMFSSAFKDNFNVVGQIEVDTKRLDDIQEVDRIDFLKIDIQGGELEVFRNATRKLAQTAVIQTEVSFVNLYKDQPALGDIDIELRKQGFIPHCFAALKRYVIAPFVVDNDPLISMRQLLEGDLVYVRDFRNAKALDDDQIRHLCLIAHACYESFDLAFRCILILQERGSIAKNASQQYISLLNNRGTAS